MIHFKRVLSKHRGSGLAPVALYRIAECYYNKGDYERALQNFRDVAQDYPDSAMTGAAHLGVVGV